ncbi:cell wall degradation protein [Cellvibrio japonicus Ueda107]|uniref:Cell wall degradation protein n=2 Tax=Cellvibrio japonicus TaxID=155077 RepID=B3PD73_CELJU|nr:cell wall degradation protein [Cellvibrio japonicus Ueda107]
MVVLRQPCCGSGIPDAEPLRSYGLPKKQAEGDPSTALVLWQRPTCCVFVVCEVVVGSRMNLSGGWMRAGTLYRSLKTGLMLLVVVELLWIKPLWAQSAVPLSPEQAYEIRLSQLLAEHLTPYLPPTVSPDNQQQTAAISSPASASASSDAPVGDKPVVSPLTNSAADMPLAVAEFYALRNFRPVWVSRDQYQALIQAIAGLAEDGLEPEDYQLTRLQQGFFLVGDMAPEVLPLRLADELTATTAYLRALFHLYNGKVDAEGLHPQWQFSWSAMGPEPWRQAIATAVTSGVVTSGAIDDVFARARPQHRIYSGLRAGLLRYRQLVDDGGWPALESGPTLKPCMIDPLIAVLRRRLAVSGEYQPPVADQRPASSSLDSAAGSLPPQVRKCLAAAPPAAITSKTGTSSTYAPSSSAASQQGEQVDVDNAQSALLSSASSSPASTADASVSSLPAINPDEVFDEYLVEAVKTFQREQYLEVDGAIGPATRAALNVSAKTRLEQIRVNLDRARWLLHSIPPEMVLVDIAGFKVTYFKASQPIWRSRVQVGMAYRTSPLFRSEVNYITLNPTWTVPPTILRKDILPKLRKGDLSYLRDNRIRVLNRQGQELDPASIDWQRPGAITLRQDAGPKAALGKAVIRFPNSHAVYLHDTPHQRLFEKSQRAFSSGCIRVERALELVQLLLSDTPGWDAAAIEKALATGNTRNVILARRVPILLAYWTADVIDEHKVVFKPDIYARDPVLLAALNRRD